MQNIKLLYCSCYGHYLLKLIDCLFYCRTEVSTMPQQIMWTPPRATRSRILIRPRHHSRKPLISIQVKKKLKKYRNSVIIDCYTDCIFAFVQGQLTSSCIMNHSFLGIEVKFLFLLTLWNCGSIFVYINCKHLYSICCIFIFFYY